MLVLDACATLHDNTELEPTRILAGVATKELMTGFAIGVDVATGGVGGVVVPEVSEKLSVVSVPTFCSACITLTETAPEGGVIVAVNVLQPLLAAGLPNQI